MRNNLKAIQAFEDKYGPVIFGMGMTQLMDVGHSNVNDDVVKGWIAQIIAKGKADEANGTRSFMTPEFQCEIIYCAAELAKFTPWTLFAYIKKHMHIGGV
jgi:hypothetical protein